MSKMFSLGGLQAVLPAAPVNAPGSVLEASQAALLAACAAQGISTATDLQLACRDANEARDMRRMLLSKVASGYSERFGVLKGHEYFSRVVMAAGGGTLSVLADHQAALLVHRTDAPEEAENAGVDEARSVGRAYAEKMHLFDVK